MTDPTPTTSAERGRMRTEHTLESLQHLFSRFLAGEVPSANQPLSGLQLVTFIQTPSGELVRWSEYQESQKKPLELSWEEEDRTPWAGGGDDIGLGGLRFVKTPRGPADYVPNDG